MKRSWGFLIPKYYNYGFKNFYATVIQRAYRNYKKRPESLAKRIWEAVRNNGTPDRWKYLGIISRDVYYYYINGELIESNGKIDHFNVLYRHTLFSARTWAEEKRDQLTYRLDWITFERARKLLQQEGYALLSGRYYIDWSTMLKWAQNPKYYQNTEENLNSRRFIRKDKLEPYDIVYQGSVPKDWWYKHKAWLEDPRNNSIKNKIIQSWKKMFRQSYPYLLRSSSVSEIKNHPNTGEM
jgi:hypothetical protein